MNYLDFSNLDQNRVLANGIIEAFLNYAKTDRRVQHIEVDDHYINKAMFNCSIQFFSGGELKGVYSLQRIAGCLHKEPATCEQIARDRQLEIEKQADYRLKNARLFLSKLESHALRFTQVDEVIKEITKGRRIKNQAALTFLDVFYNEGTVLNYGRYIEDRNNYIKNKNLI